MEHIWPYHCYMESQPSWDAWLYDKHNSARSLLIIQPKYCSECARMTQVHQEKTSKCLCLPFKITLRWQLGGSCRHANISWQFPHKVSNYFSLTHALRGWMMDANCKLNRMRAVRGLLPVRPSEVTYNVWEVASKIASQCFCWKKVSVSSNLKHGSIKMMRRQC